MEESSKTSDITILRNDFNIFKTQTLIWAGCGVALIFVLLFTLIYAFVLIRKLRINFEQKLKDHQRSTRFTIDRPKLLTPALTYDPPLPVRKPQNGVSAPSYDYRSPKRPKPLQLSPSYNSGNLSLPSSFDYNEPQTPTSPPRSPPNGLQSPRSPSDLQSPKSPSPSAILRVDYYKKVNESFLNRTRAAYSPKEDDNTPRTPISPTAKYPSFAENNSPKKDGKFFS